MKKVIALKREQSLKIARQQADQENQIAKAIQQKSHEESKAAVALIDQAENAAAAKAMTERNMKVARE